MRFVIIKTFIKKIFASTKVAPITEINYFLIKLNSKQKNK